MRQRRHYYHENDRSYIGGLLVLGVIIAVIFLVIELVK